MCCSPLAKRQPFQRSHCVCVVSGQSNFGDDPLGDVDRDPAERVDHSLNRAKSTMITWLIGRPVYAATVLIASGGPPA